MSNELERVARVIRPWLSQTMQDPDDWSETRARDIAADVIAHALTPTPDVGVLAEVRDLCLDSVALSDDTCILAQQILAILDREATQ